jgi:hypothetical protein
VVEQLTFNQWVEGSNPSGLTISLQIYRFHFSLNASEQFKVPPEKPDSGQKGTPSIALVRSEMAAMEERLEGKIDSVEERLNGKISLVRSDMGAMEDRLPGEIAVVRSDMTSMEERLEGKIAIVRTDMADMQVKLMHYMTTLVLGSGGVIIAAMKLLP